MFKPTECLRLQHLLPLICLKVHTTPLPWLNGQLCDFAISIAWQPELQTSNQRRMVRNLLWRSNLWILEVTPQGDVTCVSSAPLSVLPSHRIDGFYVCTVCIYTHVSCKLLSSKSNHLAEFNRLESYFSKFWSVNQLKSSTKLFSWASNPARDQTYVCVVNVYYCIVEKEQTLVTNGCSHTNSDFFSRFLLTALLKFWPLTDLRRLLLTDSACCHPHLYLPSYSLHQLLCATCSRMRHLIYSYLSYLRVIINILFYDSVSAEGKRMVTMTAEDLDVVSERTHYVHRPQQHCLYAQGNFALFHSSHLRYFEGVCCGHDP